MKRFNPVTDTKLPINLMHYLLLMIASIAVSTTVAVARECPDGYRLHYQGFCIHIEDELLDDPDGYVRTTTPSNLQAGDAVTELQDLERIGYKFNNMKHGEFCKNAYVRISRDKYAYPVAFALGEESCGFSEIDVASLAAAEAFAMAECKKQTTGCRIIFPERE